MHKQERVGKYMFSRVRGMCGACNEHLLLYTLLRQYCMPFIGKRDAEQAGECAKQKKEVQQRCKLVILAYLASCTCVIYWPTASLNNNNLTSQSLDGCSASRIYFIFRMCLYSSKPCFLYGNKIQSLCISASQWGIWP